jgi:hypothetical protein
MLVAAGRRCRDRFGTGGGDWRQLVVTTGMENRQSICPLTPGPPMRGRWAGGEGAELLNARRFIAPLIYRGIPIASFSWI